MKKMAALCCAVGIAAGVPACIEESPVVGSEGDEYGTSGAIDLIGSALSFLYGFAPDPFIEEPPLCIPRELPTSADGVVACSVVSGRVQPSTECSCDDGRRPVNADLRRAYLKYLEMSASCGPGTGMDCEKYCVCEELPATGTSAEECLNERAPSESSSGWCYVDPARGIGSAALVADCASGSERLLRVLRPEAGTTFVLACAGGALTPGDAPDGEGAVGAPCLPSEEKDRNFNGFGMLEVTLDLGSPDCRSNICLVHHFQGRVSCPYGQSDPAGPSGAACFVPGSDQPVAVPVDPQRVERPAMESAVCSCRCDGPGPGPFCICPSGTRCEPLVPGGGLPGQEKFTGSFCIPSGSQYDPLHPPIADVCTALEMNCGDARPY